MRAMAAAIAVVLVATASASAQSAGALVVIVKGDKQFHQPGCPLVAKAGSNVTIAKRGEVLRRGLTAHDCATLSPDAAGGDPNQEKVVSQPGDNKYHRPTCSKVGKSPTTLTLDEAGRKLWPCPVCKPPIRQRKAS